jgi:hypothetical protein
MQELMVDAEVNALALCCSFAAVKCSAADSSSHYTPLHYAKARSQEKYESSPLHSQAGKAKSQKTNNPPPPLPYKVRTGAQLTLEKCYCAERCLSPDQYNTIFRCLEFRGLFQNHPNVFKLHFGYVLDHQS